MKPPFSSAKSKKEIYKEQYEASKQGGESFFPDTMARDAIVALGIVVVLFLLAIFFPASSEAPADPTTTTYNPRPEWYFLFFPVPQIIPRLVRASCGGYYPPSGYNNTHSGALYGP